MYPWTSWEVWEEFAGTLAVICVSSIATSEEPRDWRVIIVVS